jgi:hypothetical protein
VEFLERAFGHNLRDFVRASRGGLAIPCAGGVAAFLGPESPLTTVKGAGSTVDNDAIEPVEAFFRASGSERALFEVAEWAPGNRLLSRGYEIVGSEHVMLRPAPFECPAPGLDVVSVSERDWPDVQLRANDAGDSSEWRRIVAMCGALPGVMRFGVRDAGGWIACAEVMPAGEVAIFGNDATAPRARARGAQTALIQARLRAISAMPFTCAAAEVAPGSTSERNYLRCGFELAYKRLWYARAIPR